MILNCYCQCIYLTLCLQMCLTEAVVPKYLPADRALPRIEIIKHYFRQGFFYKEIVCLLLIRHGVVISLRQLKRILRRNNLRRRHEIFTPIIDVIKIIRGEMEDSGQCIGYRAMWRRLILDHGLYVTRDSVLQIMRTIDSEGVALRKAQRFRRRMYYAHGPNYVWHVDGYDKLKPFGFGIHAAIDGYSRRLLWLEVSSSNNNSSPIATYYLETLKQIGCAPRLLRCDLGTENAMISLLQPYFRYSASDSMAGMKSFMYGKSTSNQRIEAFWGILRRQGIHWWINLFKDLRDTNEYDDSDPLHVECLRYCFMHVIQAELDRFVVHWNLHEVRSQRVTEAPHGKPDVLFFIPEAFGARDYGTKVDEHDVKLCMELYGAARNICCSEFKELINLLKPNVQIPVDAISALELYFELTEMFSQY